MFINLILFYLSIILYLMFKFNLEKKKKGLRRESNFFFLRSQIIYSILVIFFILVIFLIIYRIIKMILNENPYIQIDYYIYLFYHTEINKITIIILLLNLVIYFFSFRNFVAIFVKKHFLKLHYFYFLRFFFYQKFLFFIHEKLPKKNLIKTLIKFFLGNFLKYFILFSFFKNFIFDGGKLFIGFLPYYSLYFLIYNYCKFLKKLNLDLEKLTLSYYYSNNYYNNQFNLNNLYYYHNNLLFNELHKFEIIMIDLPNLLEFCNKKKPELFPPKFYNYI